MKKIHLLWALKDNQKAFYNQGGSIKYLRLRAITQDLAWLEGCRKQWGQESTLKQDHWELWMLYHGVKSYSEGYTELWLFLYKGVISTDLWIRKNHLATRWKMDCRGEKLEVDEPLEITLVIHVRDDEALGWGSGGLWAGEAGRRLGKHWKENRQCLLWEKRREGWSAERMVRETCSGAAKLCLPNNSPLYWMLLSALLGGGCFMLCIAVLKNIQNVADSIKGKEGT